MTMIKKIMFLVFGLSLFAVVSSTVVADDAVDTTQTSEVTTDVSDSKVDDTTETISEEVVTDDSSATTDDSSTQAAQ